MYEIKDVDRRLDIIQAAIKEQLVHGKYTGEKPYLWGICMIENRAFVFSENGVSMTMQKLPEDEVESFTSLIRELAKNKRNATYNISAIILKKIAIISYAGAYAKKKLEVTHENYVKKIDITARFDKIESILERLFDKLESKQDK